MSKRSRPRSLRKESVEFQLGQSDYLLGYLQSECPFHETQESHSDASEWRRGWLSELQITNSDRDAGEKANPPWKRRSKH